MRRGSSEQNERFMSLLHSERELSTTTSRSLVLALVAVGLLLVIVLLSELSDQRMKRRLTDTTKALSNYKTGMALLGGSCIGFRATHSCSPYGYRAPDHDKGCMVKIGAKVSGFCECSGNVIVEKACGEVPEKGFMCAERCQQGVADASIKTARWTRQNATKVALEGAELKVAVVMVVLGVDGQLGRVLHSIRRFDRAVNRALRYPYIIFDTRVCSALAQGDLSRATHRAECVAIEASHWQQPPLNPSVMRTLVRKHGGNHAFMVPRHLHRWFAGFVQKQSILAEFDYYWRLDVDTFFHCSFPYNPVAEMNKKGQKIGFFMTGRENAKAASNV